MTTPVRSAAAMPSTLAANDDAAAAPKSKTLHPQQQTPLYRTRHAAVYARDAGAVFRRAGDLRAALLRAADSAGAVARFRRIAGGKQPVAFGLHRSAGDRPDVHRAAVRRHWPQVGDGGSAATGGGMHADLRLYDQLARHFADARADRPVAERRGGGRHDLPQRRDPPQLRRLLNGGCTSAATRSAA